MATTLGCHLAWSQTSPGFVQGQILNADTPPTPNAQPGLNNAFAGKADFPVQNFTLAPMPQGTTKCNPVGSAVPAQDCTVVQMLQLLGLGAGMLASCVIGVDFNQPNTDFLVSLPMPPPTINYHIQAITLANATNSLTLSTIGIFSSAGGSGAVIVSNITPTVSSNNSNTLNNAQELTVQNQNTIAYNYNPLFIRIGTPQGSGATADVCIYYRPIP